MAMLFDHDFSGFDDIGFAFPEGARTIKVKVKENVTRRRRDWLPVKEKAFVAAVDAVAREVARRVHTGMPLGHHFFEWAGCFLLFGDIVGKDDTIVLAVFFFDEAGDEGDVDIPVGAGIHAPLPLLHRYVVYSTGRGFRVERLLADLGGPGRDGPSSRLTVLRCSPPELATAFGAVRALQVTVGSVREAIAEVELHRETTQQGIAVHVSHPAGTRTERFSLLDGAGFVTFRIDHRAPDKGRSATGRAADGTDAERIDCPLDGSLRLTARLLSTTSTPDVDGPMASDRPRDTHRDPARTPDTGGLLPRPTATHLCGRADIPGSSTWARLMRRNIPESGTDGTTELADMHTGNALASKAGRHRAIATRRQASPAPEDQAILTPVAPALAERNNSSKVLVERTVTEPTRAGPASSLALIPAWAGTPAASGLSLDKTLSSPEAEIQLEFFASSPHPVFVRPY